MAFRLIPEQSQVKNNLRVREKSGSAANSFPGVPVFQVLLSVALNLDISFEFLFRVL
ncbi:Protein TIC 22-like [Arachis hypogaea]|uniref:Protein TIC 22-like n=2 Tax=Arachis hypogaea TaxID=3818 RepID=A0A6B9V8R8_ARAHY|nr:Protein TIC 22-like [Arachis hypogaea]